MSTVSYQVCIIALERRIKTMISSANSSFIQVITKVHYVPGNVLDARDMTVNTTCPSYSLSGGEDRQQKNPNKKNLQPNVK